MDIHVTGPSALPAPVQVAARSRGAFITNGIIWNSYVARDLRLRYHRNGRCCKQVDVDVEARCNLVTVVVAESGAVVSNQSGTAK